MSCPSCSEPAVRVLYFGLPHWLCPDEDCSVLFGFWASLTEHLPFNGYMWAYEPGSYFSALWSFLFG